MVYFEHHIQVVGVEGSLHMPLLCSENWYFLISFFSAERPGAAEQCFFSYLILGNTISNMCENEGTELPPSCQTHQLNGIRCILLNDGGGMKFLHPAHLFSHVL